MPHHITIISGRKGVQHKFMIDSEISALSIHFSHNKLVSLLIKTAFWWYPAFLLSFDPFLNFFFPVFCKTLQDHSPNSYNNFYKCQLYLCFFFSLAMLTVFGIFHVLSITLNSLLKQLVHFALTGSNLEIIKIKIYETNLNPVNILLAYHIEMFGQILVDHHS